jgi:hypothetical protein
METSDNHVPKQLKPYLWKKGVSANPAGRPKGKTLKTFAREYLEAIPDEEKLEYLASIDPKIVWEMAEGKAKQDVEVSGELTSKIISVDE